MAVGFRARFIFPSIVFLFLLLPGTASAQCWYEAAVYAELYDNGVDAIEVYGAGWDGSYCPPCPHSYQIAAVLWFNGEVVDQESNNSWEATASYGATQAGWASYEVNFIINCPCAGSIGVGPVGGGQQVQRPTSCGDVRDNIIEEYRAGQVAWTPTCGDFSTSGGTANFGWSELNRSPGSGHPPYGIVRSVLWSGLENTRSNYNRGGIVIDSGYRCPHGNALVGGAYQSRHMWGDAADMHSQDHPWSQAEWTLLRNAANAAGATYIEPYADDPSHVHADWR